MKNFITVLLITVAVCTSFAACSGVNGLPPQTESRAEDKTERAAASAVSEASTVEESSLAVTETEPETETTADQHAYDFLQKGVWYLYFEDSKTAYAFTFTGKDRVEIAYFNSDNTAGFDAKYFTTSEDYEINDAEGEIIVEITDPIHENESFLLTVQGEKLCYGEDPLEKEKDINLDTVFSHFNG